MDTYGLIGFPLGHSFSARYFSEKFRKEGIEAQYVNLEMQDVTGLRKIIEQDKTLRGLNVTIPHKRAVMPMLDALSPEARRIGAVNVISINREGERLHLTGHNTDVIGFMTSIRPLLSPHHQRALVLGTGGASLAIIEGLKQLGITPQSVSRSSRGGVLSYEQLTPEIMDSHKVIVNCSPVGMHPHSDEAPAIPNADLTSEHLLYDLVYNPEMTHFMQLGAKHGAVVKNGLEMLHLQAEAAWEIWSRP